LWAAAEKKKKKKEGEGEEVGRGGRWAKRGREGLGFVFSFSNPFQTNFQTFLNQTLLHLFTIFFINYFKDF
jgi:hypothetical protein